MYVRKQTPEERQRLQLWRDLAPIGPEGWSHLTDPRLKREVTFMKGLSKYDVNWWPVRCTLATALSICMHHRPGTKGGLSVVFSCMPRGQRLEARVLYKDFVYIDTDSGEHREQIVAALALHDILAAVTTSYSHLKTRHEIALTYAEQRLPEGVPLDDPDFIREIIRSKGFLDCVVDSAAYHGIEDDKLVIKTCPVHRHRIIIPLAAPYVPATDGGKAGWVSVLNSVAEMLGVKLDHSCTDLNRVMLLPRHPVGADFFVGLYGGSTTLDWKDHISAPVVVGGAPGVAAPVRSKLKPAQVSTYRPCVNHRPKSPTTPGGIALLPWSRTERGRWFDPVDWIMKKAPDLAVRRLSNTKWAIRCPNEEQHTEVDPLNEGCFCSTGQDGGWTILCQHNACVGLNRLDFLALLKKD